MRGRWRSPRDRARPAAGAARGARAVDRGGAAVARVLDALARGGRPSRDPAAAGSCSPRSCVLPARAAAARARSTRSSRRPAGSRRPAPAARPRPGLAAAAAALVGSRRSCWPPRSRSRWPASLWHNAPGPRLAFQTTIARALRLARRDPGERRAAPPARAGRRSRPGARDAGRRPRAVAGIDAAAPRARGSWPRRRRCCSSVSSPARDLGSARGRGARGARRPGGRPAGRASSRRGAMARRSLALAFLLPAAALVVATRRARRRWPPPCCSRPALSRSRALARWRGRLAASASRSCAGPSRRTGRDASRAWPSRSCSQRPACCPLPGLSRPARRGGPAVAAARRARPVRPRPAARRARSARASRRVRPTLASRPRALGALALAAVGLLVVRLHGWVAAGQLPAPVRAALARAGSERAPLTPLCAPAGLRDLVPALAARPAGEPGLWMPPVYSEEWARRPHRLCSPGWKACWPGRDIVSRTPAKPPAGSERTKE